MVDVCAVAREAAVKTAAAAVKLLENIVPDVCGVAGRQLLVEPRPLEEQVGKMCEKEEKNVSGGARGETLRI